MTLLAETVYNVFSVLSENEKKRFLKMVQVEEKLHQGKDNIKDAKLKEWADTIVSGYCERTRTRNVAKMKQLPD